MDYDPSLLFEYVNTDFYTHKLTDLHCEEYSRMHYFEGEKHVFLFIKLKLFRQPTYRATMPPIFLLIGVTSPQ